MEQILIDLPIFVISTHGGHVDLFDTLSSAEMYLEPVDIENGEYEIYDAKGWAISPKVTHENEVILDLAEPKVNFEDRLKAHIVCFLNTIDAVNSIDESRCLEYLIQRLKSFQI